MPAKSKSQRRLFALALQLKKGEIKSSDVSDEIKDLAKLSLKDLEDFVNTDETGLPDKVDEDTVNVNPNMNVPGMGNIKLPGNPGTLDGFSTQEVGSGDLPLGKKKKKRKVVMTFEQFMNQ